MIANVWNWVSGKKTYIVCIVTIAYALVQGWTGAITSQVEMEMILAALGLGGLRHGMTTGK